MPPEAAKIEVPITEASPSEFTSDEITSDVDPTAKRNDGQTDSDESSQIDMLLPEVDTADTRNDGGTDSDEDVRFSSEDVRFSSEDVRLFPSKNGSHSGTFKAAMQELC